MKPWPETSLQLCFLPCCLVARLLLQLSDPPFLLTLKDSKLQIYREGKILPKAL